MPDPEKDDTNEVKDLGSGAAEYAGLPAAQAEGPALSAEELDSYFKKHPSEISGDVSHMARTEKMLRSDNPQNQNSREENLRLADDIAKERQYIIDESAKRGITLDPGDGGEADQASH